jgi:subtilisin family serine protease
VKSSGVILLLVVLTTALGVRVDDSVAAGGTRILVTFSDPGMSSAARAGPARPGYSRRTSTYLVSVNVNRAANRLAKDFGLHKIDEWPIVPLKVHCLVFAVGDGIAVEQLLGRIRERPEVESAQLLNEFEISGALNGPAADPYSGLQHNLDTLELAKAHAWSLGSGIRVTIIDTGADFHHPDLKSQIRTHEDFADAGHGEFAADAHGTAVAGVIGAASNNGFGVVGVAPSAQLSVLKACWYRNGSGARRAVCNSFTLAKALSYALDSETDVINLSLGGPSDELLGRLVGLALYRGIVVVAAAPAKQQLGFPANIDGVIVVESEQSLVANEVSHRFAVQAPGDEILVPVPGGGYDYASGSSLSAAHVSGIVALLVAKQAGLTRDEIRLLLIGSRSIAGKSVNACRALAQLLRQSGCRDDEAMTQSM